jgi:hypothetical protein
MSLFGDPECTVCGDILLAHEFPCREKPVVDASERYAVVRFTGLCQYFAAIVANGPTKIDVVWSNAKGAAYFATAADAEMVARLMRRDGNACEIAQVKNLAMGG